MPRKCSPTARFRLRYRVIAVVIGTAAAGLIPGGATAGPAIASDWATMDIGEPECFARAEAAIDRLGFGLLERTQYSRFGQTGDYTVQVRCVQEKGVILFIAAGPSRSRALNYQIELHRNFLIDPP